MERKRKKTKEEKIVEEYFPVDKEDIRYSIEKKVKTFSGDKRKSIIEKKYKQIDRKSLETVEKISTKKKIRKTNKNSKSKKKAYSQPKIKLKKGGYELVITEKPQAALKIASALGKSTKRGTTIPYYEVSRNKKKIIVACAVGHLFTLKQEGVGQKIPIFDIKWVPNYIARKRDFTKKYYDTLLKLAKEAGTITVATDYDIEGEVIGWNIVRFICDQKNASRMKFSTLTEKELNRAYDEKEEELAWGQAFAGETRHYLDWFYGINLSRALMSAIKTTGKFRIISAGRVQGPTLNLIVQKEKEIQSFKPEKYWQIFIDIEDKKKQKIQLKHNKDIFEKKELKKFNNLKGKKIQVTTTKKKQILPPNPPFNLTNLQTEAYRFHGITPSNTLRAAQSLYLAGLISYPRTSSQKLPEAINYKEILKKIAKKYNVEELITKSKPIEGKKSDPAHPSIYPTGNSQILSGDDEKVYNLIVKRFLSLFCDDAIIDNKTIKADVTNLIRLDPKLKGRFDKGKLGSLYFSTRGSSISKKAWLEIYPSKIKENEVPDIEGEAEILKLKEEEKETQPPKRYSPASIISHLEKKNLGTKATRSSILETLYDRGYIQDKSIKATPFGISLISTLEKHSPIIIDEKLTRKFESEMESILKSKRNFEEKEKKIIDEAKKAITKISKDFERNEKKIGEELLDATLKQREKEKIENTLTPCPICKKGDLAITYSKKTRRHFIACNAYPDCKTTYSLPPNSLIKKAEKICEECNFPMLMSIRKGKRPWIFCFNTVCPTNKERIEKYRKEHEKN